MSETGEQFINLLISLRDAYLKAIDAINAYLATQAPPEVRVEQVQTLFPKEFVSLLSFEDAGNAWKIKPREYLGSETFAKVAGIMRQHGGEYISAGKESHFRLPKAK